MTTGTTAPYLELPEDINPPKPEYFHDVFHLVHAYIQLLNNVSEFAIPGKGLVKLYSYRMGVLDLDTTVLEQAYREKVATNRLQQTQLQIFANSAIAYNIQALYQLITNTLSKNIIDGFGDDKCLSTEVVHALNQFAKLQSRVDTQQVKRYDSMDALVETCHYNATYARKDGTSSSEAIVRIIAVLDRMFEESLMNPFNGEGRKRLLNALKIVFYIGCRYYHLNLLRFSDELIKRSYDRSLDITDFTLAAIPFDPTLVQACSDETSSVSRWGIEYLQSLETVLLYFGGVRYAAIFTVEANGNKGVSNV